MKWSKIQIKKGSEVLCETIADGVDAIDNAPNGFCTTNVQLNGGDKVHAFKIMGEEEALRVSNALNGFTGHLITIL